MSEVNWVTTKFEALINLATADSISIGEAFGDDYADEETHAVYAVWWEEQDVEFVLFAGSEKDCKLFKDYAKEFLGADDIVASFRARQQDGENEYG